METFDAIKERRSVKHYDQNHSLTDEEINQLMSLAVLSPTSFNMQNWRFVLVKDSEKKKQIRAASWDQAQVTDCSLLVDSLCRFESMEEKSCTILERCTKRSTRISC